MRTHGVVQLHAGTNGPLQRRRLWFTEPLTTEPVSPWIFLNDEHQVVLPNCPCPHTLKPSHVCHVSFMSQIL